MSEGETAPLVETPTGRGSLAGVQNAMAVILAEPDSRTKSRDDARKVLRAAYTKTRHVLEELHGAEGTCSHGPGPYQQKTDANDKRAFARLDKDLLVLIVRAAAGDVAGQQLQENLATRMSIWTGGTKAGVGVVEFLRICDEELLSDNPPLPLLEPERARLGLVLVYGTAILYRYVADRLANHYKNHGAARLPEFEDFVAAVMRMIPTDTQATVIADIRGAKERDAELMKAWKVIIAEPHMDFKAFLTGCLAISDLSNFKVAENKSGDGSSSWFEDNVLRTCVAQRSVPQTTPWKTATFQDEGNLGLRMVQVTLNTSGQDWLLVHSVKEGSAAKNKRIRVGMLLYGIDGICIVGLPKADVKKIWQSMLVRPITLEVGMKSTIFSMESIIFWPILDFC